MSLQKWLSLFSSVTYLHGDKCLDWSWLNMDSWVADFNNFAIKHLVVFWHACNCSEAHFEDDVSTGVLDEAIADLPVAFLLLFVQKQNNIAVLWVASAYERLFNSIHDHINRHSSLLTLTWCAFLGLFQAPWAQAWSLCWCWRNKTFEDGITNLN